MGSLLVVTAGVSGITLRKRKFKRPNNAGILNFSPKLCQSIVFICFIVIKSGHHTTPNPRRRRGTTSKAARFS